MNGRDRLLLVCTLAASLTLTLAFAGPAQAGCFMEYESCAGCARTAMKRAIWRLDFGGIRQANFMMYDCAIDLYHCTILGQHHSAPCAL